MRPLALITLAALGIAGAANAQPVYGGGYGYGGYSPQQAYLQQDRAARARRDAASYAYRQALAQHSYQVQRELYYQRQARAARYGYGPGY